MKKDVWSLFPTVAMRPHFLYNQAVYWVATHAITLDKATNLYPEKADYIGPNVRALQENKKRRRLRVGIP